MNKSLKYFDPETLAKIRPLGLRAKTLVEGWLTGLHRSPLKGHSLEFAQHREYVPGDDLRLVDWKVFARSDRYYLKQYEDETNLTCYLLVDQSASMNYRASTNALSKLEYAQLVACSLAYLVTEQRDSIGLVTFASQVENWLPARSSTNQFDDIIQILEKPHDQDQTKVADVLSDVVQRLSGTALIILISDLFDDADRVAESIRLARHAGHDLFVMQVLDSDEIDFPFDQVTEFESLETSAMSTTSADPMLIAGAYRRAMQEFQNRLRGECQQQNADYCCLRTDKSLVSALPEALSRRLRRDR